MLQRLCRCLSHSIDFIKFYLEPHKTVLVLSVVALSIESPVAGEHKLVALSKVLVGDLVPVAAVSAVLHSADQRDQEQDQDQTHGELLLAELCR